MLTGKKIKTLQGHFGSVNCVLTHPFEQVNLMLWSVKHKTLCSNYVCLDMNNKIVCFFRSFFLEVVMVILSRGNHHFALLRWVQSYPLLISCMYNIVCNSFSPSFMHTLSLSPLALSLSLSLSHTHTHTQTRTSRGSGLSVYQDDWSSDEERWHCPLNNNTPNLLIWTWKHLCIWRKTYHLSCEVNILLMNIFC